MSERACLLILIVGGLAESDTWAHRAWLIVATRGVVMGQQNALSNPSRATTRTTHVTGMVTDRIELGRRACPRRAGDPDPVRGDRHKLWMLSVLVALSTSRLVGALGDLAVSFPVLLLPAALLLVAVPPLVGGRLPMTDPVP